MEQVHKFFIIKKFFEKPWFTSIDWYFFSIIKRVAHNSFCFNQEVIKKQIPKQEKHFSVDSAKGSHTTQPLNMMKTSLLFLLLIITCLLAVENVECKPNYREALAKSLLFFQGQRSGKLPPDQQIKWRSNSGLSDGLQDNVMYFFFLFTLLRLFFLFFTLLRLFFTLLRLFFALIIRVQIYWKWEWYSFKNFFLHKW